MAIVNAFAGIMVTHLEPSVAWYEKLLDRPPDARPMEGLAEWKLPQGAWIQVYQDRERAGFSSVTLQVTNFEEHLEHLRIREIPLGEITSSDYVKTVTISDPSGNRVVLAELTTQHPATSSPVTG